MLPAVVVLRTVVVLRAVVSVNSDPGVMFASRGLVTWGRLPDFTFWLPTSIAFRPSSGVLKIGGDFFPPFLLGLVTIVYPSLSLDLTFPSWLPVDAWDIDDGDVSLDPVAMTWSVGGTGLFGSFGVGGSLAPEAFFVVLGTFCSGSSAIVGYGTGCSGFWPGFFGITEDLGSGLGPLDAAGNLGFGSGFLLTSLSL